MRRSRRKRARLPAGNAGSGGDDENEGAAIAAPAVDNPGGPAAPTPVQSTVHEGSSLDSELPAGPRVASLPATPASALGQEPSRAGGRRNGTTNFTLELRIRVLSAALHFMDEKKRLPNAQDLAAIMDPVRATASPGVGRLPERFGQVYSILRGVGTLESKALGAFEQVEANPRASKRFHILAAYHPVLCVLSPTLTISTDNIRSNEPLDPEFIKDALERVDIDAAVQKEADVRAGAPGAIPMTPAASSSPSTSDGAASASRGTASRRFTSGTVRPTRSTYAGEAVAGRQVFSSAVPSMSSYSANMEGLASLQRVVAQGVILSNVMTTWFASALADPRGVPAFAQDTPVPAAGTALLAECSSADFVRSMSESVIAATHGGPRSSDAGVPASAAAPNTTHDTAHGTEIVARVQESATEAVAQQGSTADTASSLLHLATSPVPLRAPTTRVTRSGRDGQSDSAARDPTNNERE